MGQQSSRCASSNNGSAGREVPSSEATNRAPTEQANGSVKSANGKPAEAGKKPADGGAQQNGNPESSKDASSRPEKITVSTEEYLGLLDRVDALEMNATRAKGDSQDSAGKHDGDKHDGHVDEKGAGKPEGETSSR